MPPVTKVSAKALFETGDVPTSADFSDLVDSYQDYDATLFAIATAAQGGQTGLLVIEATAQVTLRALGAAVTAFLSAATTSRARDALELGALATAAGVSLTRIANQASGAIFGFNTAGSAAAIGGSSGQLLISQGSATAVFVSFVSAMATAGVSAHGVVTIATTADTVSANRADRVPTVATFRAHPGVCKAWLQCNTSTAAIANSMNVTAVTNQNAGNFHVAFTIPFATSAYVLGGGALALSEANPHIMALRATTGNQSAAGCKISVGTGGGVASDTPNATAVFIGTQ